MPDTASAVLRLKLGQISPLLRESIFLRIINANAQPKWKIKIPLKINPSTLQSPLMSKFTYFFLISF